MDILKNTLTFLRRLVPGIILVALASTACLSHTLPAPIPDTLSNGMPDGAVAMGTITYPVVNLHWTPDSPIEVGRDTYEIEFLSGGTQLLYSYVIDGGTLNNLNILRLGMPFQLHLSTQQASGLDFFQVLNLQVQCGQSYTWRVRQMRTDAISDWSEPWTFQVGASPTQAPAQVWPAAGEHIHGGQLTWNALAGTNSGILYQYEISTVRNVTGSVFFSSDPHSPDLVLEHGYAGLMGLQNGQLYYWHVRAYYYPDCSGPWSPVRMFVWDAPTVELGGLPPPSPVCPPEGCGGGPTLTPLPTWTPLVSAFSIGGLGQADLLTNTPLPTIGAGISLANIACRTGPGTIFPVLSYLAAGESADVLGKNLDGKWLLLRACAGSGPAWVRSEYIELKFDASILPTLASPPTPTPVIEAATDTPPAPATFDCAAAYGSSSAACSTDSRCTYDSGIKSCVNK